MIDPVSTLSSENDGKTVEVPESRIGTAADARNILGGLKRADSNERSRRRAKINGLINGNPPWSPALLKNKGQGERANINLREGEGFVAAAKTPYYDLVFEGDRFAQFTLDYNAGDPNRLEEWSNKIGARYHTALEAWDSMDSRFQRSQYQMVVHGHGPMMWEDDKDWASISLMAGQLLLPDDASADVEEWETAAVPRSYSPSYLWEKIRKPERATGAKWDVEACRRAIMQAAPEDFRVGAGNDWERYEAEIRKGSAGWNAKSKKIFVAHIYQKEFSGKITHLIILDTGPGEPTDAKEPPKNPDYSTAKESGFLYRKIGRYKRFTEIFQPFLYDVGDDGQWHSVKGAGPKILDFCDLSNRLTCRTIDGAVVSSGITVRPKSATALQETAITHIAGGIVVHPDYDVQDARFNTNFERVFSVKRDLQLTLQSNTGQYRQRVSEDNQEPTLGQAQMNASVQAVLGKGDVNRYVRQLDKWHRETFRRLLPMGKQLYESRKDIAPEDVEDEASLSQSEQIALDFYRGCIDDDVPEDVLAFRKFCKIKATRIVGYGSAQMKMMIGDKLISALPTMDERGRNTALRLWASSLGGQTLADLIYPRYDMPQFNDDHMAMATLENNALRQPDGQVLITPSQDHVVHFDIHLKDVSAHAAQTQQGQGNPMELLVHLEQAGPHMQEHMAQVAGDPTRKQQVEMMMEAWQAMSKRADQLSQQIQEAQAAEEANQPTAAPDPALLADLAKVHANAQIAHQKMMLDSQRKDQKLAADLRRKDISTAHGMRLSKKKAMAA